MPLYEYQCRKCKHRFERIQRFSDPILKKCPECGGTVDQLLSAPAVQFKGSGWYVTDYARKGSSKSAHHDKDHDAEPAAEKPAEKAEPKPKVEQKKSHDKKK